MQPSRLRSSAALGLLFASLASSCGAPPMLLTKALFAPSEATAHLVEGRHACDIQAVRARLAEPPGGRALAVDVAFAEAREQRLPPHLHAYARSDTSADVVQATFSLSPADSRRRWPEDFAGSSAVRVGLGLRLQDARYFGDGQPAAEVTFTGTVSPDAVLRRAPRAEPSGSRAWSTSAMPSGLAPALRAVRRHPWAQLAGENGDASRCDPVAWLGPMDRTLSHDDVLLLLQPWRSLELGRDAPADVSLEACALLLRLVQRDGRVDYLRVPLPLLHEGDDLSLVRQDNQVRWTRREVWRGRILAEPAETAQWPASTLALARTRIPYGFDELTYPSTIPGAIMRALVAPFAWSLDLLGWTNPLIQKLLETMVEPKKPITPTGTSR